jgi:catechol 2,3-dioxygenase-like lactoylglutathione lyase family enzyme
MCIDVHMSRKFGFVGLFVKDIAHMVAFYKDIMALEVCWDGASPYAEFKHEGFRFAMFGRAQLPGVLGQTPDYTEGLNGTFELALCVGAKENVDSVYADMMGKGARCVYAPRDEPWKMRSAMIADPEGNLIEIGSDFWN